VSVGNEDVQNQFFLRLKFDHHWAMAELDQLYLRGTLPVDGSLKTESILTSQERSNYKEPRQRWVES